MAASKFFHVRHLLAGTDFLARAPKPALALVAIAGNTDALKPASDDQIAGHFAGGGALHDKSLPEGDGKLFYAATTPSTLIRAKNEGDAYARINDGVYSVEPASQDTLVRLLTKGVKPVEYVEPGKPGKSGSDGTSSVDAAASSGENVETAVG